MAEKLWQPYWERAVENLPAAEVLCHSDPPLPNAATSQAYYAAFQAAIALLIASEESHAKELRIC